MLTAGLSRREPAGADLDSIILLTGPNEGPVLSKRLADQAPSRPVRWVSTRDELLAIPSEVLPGARLVAFATGVVVPATILAQLGYGAYNFHPGPPAYPGLCPAQLAVYDRATEFGVTAHKMVARVDAGPIVGTILFRVRPGSSVNDVELAAFTQLMQLFWQLAPLLALDPEPLRDLPLSWGTRRSSRRSLRSMCEIPVDIAADELERRIGAFGKTPFDIVPTVTLHGHRFRLVREAPEEQTTPQPLAATG